MGGQDLCQHVVQRGMTWASNEFGHGKVSQGNEGHRDRAGAQIVATRLDLASLILSTFAFGPIVLALSGFGHDDAVPLPPLVLRGIGLAALFAFVWTSRSLAAGVGAVAAEAAGVSLAFTVAAVVATVAVVVALRLPRRTSSR